MSFAFLPLYTGDYLRDTRHLTPLRHGIYLLLLMHCWDQRGPLPMDEQECAGIANCRSADEIDALRYVMSRFFVAMDDGYYNKRMQREIERAGAISAARSEAGRKGYEAKAKQLPSNCQAIATTPTTTTTTTPTTTKKAKPLASSDKSLSPAGPAETVVIKIPYIGGEFPVGASLVAEFEACYPAVDIMQTLREIRAWNISNPTNQKTRRGIMKHINSWMAREQNRG